MKKQLLFIISLFVAWSINAQDTSQSKSYRLMRSSLSAGGSSSTINTSKGRYVVSQSIGQSSVIGTHSNKGYHLRQGYQQPTGKISVESQIQSSLSALVFPNPFSESVSISFKENVSKKIFISVFDISGKLIYTKEYAPLPSIELNLNTISNGTYFLKVSVNGKLFNAKLIKK